MVLALIAGGLTATVATAAPGIPIYRAHVQNVGWLPNTEPTLVGDIAGLPGSGLRVEALQVSRDIQLQAHVQNVGWMAPVAPDGIAGTTGRSLRLEAIKASLHGRRAITSSVRRSSLALVPSMLVMAGCVARSVGRCWWRLSG